MFVVVVECMFLNWLKTDNQETRRTKCEDTAACCVAVVMTSHSPSHGCVARFRTVLRSNAVAASVVWNAHAARVGLSANGQSWRFNSSDKHLISHACHCFIAAAIRVAISRIRCQRRSHEMHVGSAIAISFWRWLDSSECALHMSLWSADRQL